MVFGINNKDDLQSTHEKRIEHFKNVCKMDGFQKPVNFTFYHHNFCDLQGYNISLCKVPKCGSTYWVQVISLLKNGIENIDSILQKDRRETHLNNTGACADKLKTLSERGTKILLMGRDPFSRLYSAYVDKSFLAFKTNNRELKKTNNCSYIHQPFITTFQEFLEKVFEDLKKEESNPHWTPIFTLCNPCQSNVILQVQLEEFSKDMRYIFSRIGFSEEHQAHIRKLTTRRFDTLAGIASTVFDKQLSRKCRNFYVVAERIWISFQLQGYIDAKSKFPGHLLQITNTNDTKTATQLLMKLVEDEMTSNPLSKLEANEQRHTSLVQAYRPVRPESISKIQQIFKMDFLLFNYSISPPV